MLTRDITAKSFSFWALSATEALEVLESNKEGLSENEAKERLAFFGTNTIPSRKRIDTLALILSQFKSPLIFLLLIAGSITVALQDYKDATIIFTAALLNSALGFYQENKAEAALAHLKTYIRERIRVIREGREFEIDTSELVPGDIIHLSQGDRVPADARVMYENNLLVDESILTGESLPTQKTTHAVSFQAVIGDQKSMVFSGTLVVQGIGNAIVCATGRRTELGRIAAMVQEREHHERTPLQQSIVTFSVQASMILIGITLVIFAGGLKVGYEPLEMFITSVAIIVSAIPEGLPVAMTVILAIGVQRLAKKNGIIRKLLAAETLGSTSVILTDKTGTLTEAKMFLFKALVLNPSAQVDSETLLRLAILNSDVVVENPKDHPDKWRIIGRPLETTIIKSAVQLGLNPLQIKKDTPLWEYLPFNSNNKFSAAVVGQDHTKELVVFGAPDVLLKLTHHRDDEHKQFTAAINQLAYSGCRVLGVARREIHDRNFHLTPTTPINSLTFLGVLAFKDPLRPGVDAAVHQIAQSGIKTVIVTGDHRGTAESVAQELGLPINEENIINGSELDLMTDDLLRYRLPKLSIVSRVSPEGKVKIARAFHDAGEIVAMTGDGINDAPSLKQADIGVAMGSGTDVAKDVAELVLLDDNYETIVEAIKEGRRTMENIRKVMVYLLSSVTDELFLIGGALLAGIALPLSAIQILWINLITESFPAIALAFEEHADHHLQRPSVRHNLFDYQMKILIFAIGIPTSFFMFITYFFLLRAGFDVRLVQTFIFASLGTYSLFLIFAVRSLQKSILSYNPFSNYYIVYGSAIGFLLMAGAVYLPFMQNLLGTVALPPLWVAGVIGIGLLNVLTIELGKRIIKDKAPAPSLIITHG